MLFLLLLQAASAQAPDIELNANIRARSVTIEKQGNASLKVTTNPEGGNVVDIEAPKANGRKTLRNLNARVRAEARIGDPLSASENKPGPAETTPQQ